jgi:type II secretory pathway component PulC
MRLVVGLLALTLSGSFAFADDAKAPEPQPEPTAAPSVAPKAKVGLRVVRILPESNQALLFDKNRGTHVLAEVGSTVEGYTVDAIDDDEVTLSSSGKELVLSAPPSRGNWRSLREERAEKAAVAAKKIETPADPYADATDANAPVDPYADPKVREVSAPSPIVAGEGGVRVADASSPADPYDDASPVPSLGATIVAGSLPAAPIVAAGPAPQAKHKADPAWMSPDASSDAATAIDAPDTGDAPADPYAAAEPAPAAPVITPTVLSRSELNVALADFGKLTNLLRGSFTAQGARLDVVADGSVFAKAGLRSGDVVTAVDNTPLHSIDDAADLYVRASTTRAANISVLRAGKPLTLRVLIH